MNNKIDVNHSKRLLKTRQEFSQLSKREVNNWKRINQMKDNKRLEELQNQEIQTINKQLIHLRHEYRRITSERGSAHKWAQIVDKHESEANEFQKRRNSSVLKRSQHILNDFINQNTIKQNNIKIEKQNQILRRKQLMKSSFSAETDDKQVLQILRHLKDLEKSETVLRDIIKKRTELSHSEDSIERIAQKVFWPKKLVPKQEFLVSNVSSNDSNISTLSSKPNQSLNQLISESNDPKEKQKYFDSKQTEVMKLSSISDETNDYYPIKVATKIYQRLRSHPIVKQSPPKSAKVYRNVAIGTTPRKLFSDDSNESDSIDNQSMNSSLQTSYLSVPMTPNVSNKTTKALKQFYKNLENRFNASDGKSLSIPTIDLESDSLHDSCVDPLIVRINKLKELIDKNVGQKLTLSQKDLNCGDSALNVPQLKTSDNSNPIQEERVAINRYDKQMEDLDEFSDSSAALKTLEALSLSGLSSPSLERSSTSEVSVNINRELPSISSNIHSLESIQPISPSFVSSQPLRDRNAFWKDIFERAGIDIDINKIDEFFPTERPQSEPTVDSFCSFTLSSLSTDPNSHSTPKR